MKRLINVFLGLLVCLSYASACRGQEAQPSAPARLQIAIEPEEIVLTRGITVGAPVKHIQIIVRETSGRQRANLELVPHPFTDMNTGDSVDVNIVTVTIATPQAALSPGGLQRVDLAIGGFQRAGSYIGGITIHDTVSGERQEITIRLSVKAAWPLPAGILLVAVLVASGVNHWTRKGRHKNRLDQRIAELQKTVTLASGEGDLSLVEAEQLLAEAQQYTQDYQFERAETALAGVEQHFARYEQRKQDSEHLRQKIQELLHDVRELGETDPQNMRIGQELMRLLPQIQTDYHQTEAIVKQLERFLRAYRMARHDVQAARQKLASQADYVEKADKSKIEFLLRDIERKLTNATGMNALDEVNSLLRNVAYELSPEKITDNLFREQQYRQQLDRYEQRLRQISGAQATRIVAALYEEAAEALETNRYEAADDALQRLEQTVALVDRIKQLEQQIKGRGKKMTELRRILRGCKQVLEQADWPTIQQAGHDVQQAEEMQAGVRTHYEPFRPEEPPERPSEPETPPAEDTFAAEAEAVAASDQADTLKRLTPDDVQQQLERVLEEAAQYPKLRAKMQQWRTHCEQLLKFDELAELVDYVQHIQEEVTLYARLQAIRAQAEMRQRPAVLRLIEQAEHVFLAETQDPPNAYRRTEVLADAAKALLDEQTGPADREQVFSYIRAPRFTSGLVAYGALASYFVVALVLGLQILYASNPDFGALPFEDYLGLILWAFGLEGAKITATNVYEAYFKKAG